MTAKYNTWVVCICLGPFHNLGQGTPPLHALGVLTSTEGKNEFPTLSGGQACSNLTSLEAYRVFSRAFYVCQSRKNRLPFTQLEPIHRCLRGTLHTGAFALIFWQSDAVIIYVWLIGMHAKCKQCLLFNFAGTIWSRKTHSDPILSASEWESLMVSKSNSIWGCSTFLKRRNQQVQIHMDEIFWKWITVYMKEVEKRPVICQGDHGSSEWIGGEGWCFSRAKTT